MTDLFSIRKRNIRQFASFKPLGPAADGARGFTLIEVMVVMAIIGILAAIAIPNFLSYRQKGYDAMAKSDAKNSYDAARAYFNDFPDKVFTGITQLDSYGFRKSEGVTVTISGNADTLIITALHSNGSTTYTIDAAGRLSY